MIWLIDPDVLELIELGRANPHYAPTAEERAAFALAMREAHASTGEDRPHILSTRDGTARIAVEGVLTEEPDCMALMFGGGNTTYGAIRRSLELAESDPAVSQIELSVNSPGGEVDGLFETFDAIESTTKAIHVRAARAASAAYGLAALAGPIQATTAASGFGSIGVAASVRVDPQRVDIASTDAPKKRPDLTTAEGQAVVREELDALHELFAGAITRGRTRASGREITRAMIDADFGAGGMLLAEHALKAGMIDSIVSAPRRAAPPARVGASTFQASISHSQELLMPTTKKPYSLMTAAERHQLLRTDPFAFASARSAYLRGEEPIHVPRKPFEEMNAAERHALKQQDPIRYERERGVWLASRTILGYG